MRLFKKCEEKKLLRKVIGEVINITFGETFFDTDGVLLESKKPNHNVYLIGSVEYKITPTNGFIFVDDDKTFQYLNNNDYDMYNTMMAEVCNRFGVPKNPVGTFGTTHYMIIKQPNTFNNSTGSIGFTDGKDVSKHNHVMWEFKKMTNCPLSGSSNRDHIMSLSAILIDEKDIFTLEDGYRDADFPHYTQLRAISNNLIKLDKLIEWSPNLGLTSEIAKYFVCQKQNTKKRLYFHELPNDWNLYLIKWEWISGFIYSRPNSVSVNDFFKSSLLDAAPDKDPVLKCFMSGMPLYDDCYVVDIYQINHKIIIKEAEYKKNMTKYTSIKDCKITEIKPQSRGKKPIKRKFVVEDSDEDNKDDDKKNTPAPLTNRGGKSYTVEYVQKFTTPKCILISPYAMHMTHEKSLVLTLEEMGLEFNTYRTKCPKKLEEIIKELDVSDLLKDIYTEMHRKAMFVNGNYVFGEEDFVGVYKDSIRINTANINKKIVLIK